MPRLGLLQSACFLFFFALAPLPTTTKALDTPGIPLLTSSLPFYYHFQISLRMSRKLAPEANRYVRFLLPLSVFGNGQAATVRMSSSTEITTHLCHKWKANIDCWDRILFVKNLKYVFSRAAATPTIPPVSSFIKTRNGRPFENKSLTSSS